MRSSYLIAGLAIAAALILGLTFYMRGSQPEVEQPEVDRAPIVEVSARTPPEPASETRNLMEDTPPSPAIDEPVLVLPALNESDEFVRERLPAALPESWVEKDDLLRRAAVVVENAGRGVIPKRQLDYLAPEGRYEVREVDVEGSADPDLYVDPRTFSRYDGYLDALEALPPEDLVLLIRDTEPLLAQAMTELGTEQQLRPQLLSAIDQILAVPVIREEVPLVQPKVLYEYADPALEALSDLQKQVLRMGPDNVERLQAYLIKLRAGLTEDQAP